ncbi:MAG: (d)CMP kinase [Planctomycetota bacterium]
MASAPDRLIVTLDGPAGSGKSSVARQLAHRLGLEFLDTGAMYRGVTAMALSRGIDLIHEPFYVVELARNCPLRFDWQTDPPRLSVRGVDVTDRLRDPDVTGGVSDVAALPGVREVLVREQQRIGQEHPRLVTEGRDQGSVVFPKAEVKFYLDANASVRAQRRADQLRAAGRSVNVAEIRKQILQRDQKDSNRETAPLICPHDAIRLDTSERSLDQVLDELERTVRSKTA